MNGGERIRQSKSIDWSYKNCMIKDLFKRSYIIENLLRENGFIIINGRQSKTKTK